MDSNKEWITNNSSPDPTQTHSNNTSLSSNTLDLDSSKLLITLDQQKGVTSLTLKELLPKWVSGKSNS